MEKTEEKNILTEGNEKSFISSILNAVAKDYSDKVIIDDITKLANSNEISKGILLSTPDALRSYGENFNNTLQFIACEIENLSEHICKESCDTCGCEDKQDEEEDSDIKIEEDEEKYSHDENNNKISGLLNISFNQDMRIYKQGTKINLKQSVKEHIQNKIFDYLKSEYPKLKAELSSTIFTSSLNFNDLKNGIAEISYEIEEAY